MAEQKVIEVLEVLPDDADARRKKLAAATN